MRKTALAFVITVVALPCLATAGEVELAGFGGWSFPFYGQTFDYDPGPIAIDIPDLSIDEQGGTFRLEAAGGPVIAGALTLYATDAFGLELRLDAADVSVRTENPTFDVLATHPSWPSPVPETRLLETSEAELESAMPFSVNLKLRTEGRTRVFVSGGLSYVGDPGFSLEQSVALGVAAVILEPSELVIPYLPLRARRKPGDPKGGWGGNLGVGLQIPLGERSGLVVEGRGFCFPKQTYVWEAIIETPLGTVESQLLERLLERIDPVEFRPWWVQAVVGVSYRF